jgi:hypothetical protein
VKRILETSFCSGPPATAPRAETKNKVDALIRDDSRITSEQCAASWCENPPVIIIIGKLCYRNICARWVPQMLTVERTTPQKKNTYVQNFSSAVKKTEVLFHQ